MAKKISILLPSLRGGGLEKQMLTLCEELFRRGLNLDLVVINNINGAYTPPHDLNLIDLKAKQIRFALFSLVKYLRSTRPDILFSAETPVNALAIMAKLLCGFPERLIISEHNHLTSVAKNAARFGDQLRPFLARYLYPQADLIITVSDGVANDLIDRYRIKKHKVRTIRNLFNIKKIISDSQVKIEHPWFDKSDIPIIITIGRLSLQKDQATLIRAFARLRLNRACRLIILGEGPERPMLLQLAKDLNVINDIFMPGFVSNPYAFMAKAKVFVLSSAWEGLPGVLIEALACGIPIVATDCPSGPAEILENGRYGRLIPIGEEQAMAEAISEMLDHPHSTSMLRQRAMDFSAENIISQYLNIF